MSETLLQQVLICNRSYLEGNCASVPETGDPFIVIACIDPRLTPLLSAALGLPINRAIVIRTAGNVVSSSSYDTLRSVAAGIFVKRAAEVFIVGHTGCAMAAFSASSVIETFRSQGIPRSAFGDGDLRQWFAAFSDVRRNVIEGTDWLRRWGVVPSDLKVHGLLVNTSDGRVEVLVNGDEVSTKPAPAPERPQPEAALIAEEEALELPPSPVVPPQPLRRPIIIQETTHKVAAEPGKPPSSMADAVMMLRRFFLEECRQEHFRRSLSDLKDLLSREHNPARILPAIERIVADYKSRRPDLPPTVAYLKNSLASRGTAGLQFMELMRRILE